MTEQRAFKNLLQGLDIIDTTVEDQYRTQTYELYEEAIEYYKGALDGLIDIYQSKDAII